jgi:hypothetical protein
MDVVMQGLWCRTCNMWHGSYSEEQTYQLSQAAPSRIRPILLDLPYLRLFKERTTELVLRQNGDEWKLQIGTVVKPLIYQVF